MPGRVQRTVAAALVVAAPALDVAPPKPDLSKEGLTGLYNQKVASYESVHRDLDISKDKGGDYLSKPVGKAGGYHEGLKVTMDSGDKYLVHKPAFGGTTVTHVSNMGSKWQSSGDHTDVTGKGVGLGELVKNGGDKFNVVTSNCQHCVTDMKRTFDPQYRTARETFFDDLSGINRVDHEFRSNGEGGGDGDSGCCIS